MSDQSDWLGWLSDFRQRFIAAHGWDQRTSKLMLKDGFIVVRNGEIHSLSADDKLPSNAVPVFFQLTPGGWRLPIWIAEALTGLVSKALTSQLPPRDIVLGLLSQMEHPEEQDKDERHHKKAIFWTQQLRNAIEDPSLGGVIDNDALWQVALLAIQVGRCHTILELYQDPKLLADLLRAQAFRSGRAPDELTRRLAAERSRQLQATGREPKPRAVAEGIGGSWNGTDRWWEFPFDDLQTPTHKAICRRIEAIRKAHKENQ